MSILPSSLKQSLGGFPPPVVIDVRPPAACAAGGMLCGAVHRDPAQLGAWAGDLELGRPVIVYCELGHEPSERVAGSLRDRGYDARHLAGGFEAAARESLPLQPWPTKPPTVWVTRERPKVDRIACPWLIRRFIDPEARFLYVPDGDVLAVAASTGAVPYDVPGVAFTHDGEKCSFDAFIARYELTDPALGHLADIVRGADTSRFDLSPVSAGLLALSLGLSALVPDDHRMLRHGLVIYDALYIWCRSLQSETHNWPPAMPSTSSGMASS
jgi:rhodanese-related sulfurtransferase